MIRMVCWGQNSRDNLILVGWAGAGGSGWNEASSSPVQSLGLGAGGGRDRGPFPLTSHLMSGVQRGARPLPFWETLHAGRQTGPHPR